MWGVKGHLYYSKKWSSNAHNRGVEGHTIYLLKCFAYSVTKKSQVHSPLGTNDLFSQLCVMQFTLVENVLIIR